MMGLRFKTKKAAKEALAARGTLGREDIIETSFFGTEYQPGEHSVCVSLDPYNVRNSFARITVNAVGRIVKVV
jgi:hypothetical protein